MDNFEIEELKKNILDLIEAQKKLEDFVLKLSDSHKETDEGLLNLSRVVEGLQTDLKGLMETEPAEVAVEKPCKKEEDDGKIISSIDCAEMILIPAGDFWMGNDDEKHPDEQPLHKVFIDDYHIYKYPVTNSMYCKFLNAIRIDESVVDKWIEINDDNCRVYVDEGAYRVEEGYEDYPVVCVNWTGADTYAKWAGKRLPTEAEWEKAARGTDRRIYPWGIEWDKTRCANPYSSGDITPVGSFPEGASPYGVMDMAGNVWEWCTDWYDSTYYSNKSFENPPGPSEGTARVIRGGSWNNDSRSCRASNRNSYSPENQNYILGFRCVK